MTWRMKMARLEFAFVFCALAAVVLAPSARGQTSGSRKDDVVLNARGLPLAGAGVRVCASNATTTSPCTPLALIYSDQALTQALANPTTSDGMGNYSFYAAPGRYVIEISGPGITTRQLRDVILPNDPSAPTFTSLTTTSGINAFSVTLTGNLTVAGSAAITGALTVNGGPVPSTGQANAWTASQSFKGPAPWRDLTAFEGVPGISCFNGEEINGTISSGSHTLTLASAGAFVNNCYVGIAGAGPSTSLSTPSIASVSFTPNTVKIAANGITIASNVATVTVLNDASFNAGDTITIANTVGCPAGMNATHVIVSAPSSPYSSVGGNKFTFSFTAANQTCGGSNVDNTAGSASGNVITPATVVASAGSTTYKYIASAMDYLNGQTALTAATTISTGPSTLVGQEPITVTINCTTGAASYPVYRQTGGSGNYVYVGSALPCGSGYTTTTTKLVDYGQSLSTGPYPPMNVSATASPSGAAVGQILISQISSGGGTTTLTLATAASNSVTSHTAYHDNTTAFNAALAAAQADPLLTNRVLVPQTVLAKFCGLNLGGFAVTALPAPITIEVAGGLWPVCTMHRGQAFDFIGTGGNGGASAYQPMVSTIVVGNLNPTFFDEADQPAIISGFGFGSGGISGQLPAQTAIYTSSVNAQQYENLVIGGWGFMVSPGFYVNGCSGSGGTFNLHLGNISLYGSANTPVPAAVFDCAGDIHWKTGFINNRAMNFQSSLTQSIGGDYFFDGFASENVHDSYLISTDFTNSLNQGIHMLGGFIADGYYGNPSIIKNVTTSNSGSLVAVIPWATALVEGAVFNAGVWTLGGQGGGLGAQSLGVSAGPSNQFTGDSTQHGGLTITRGALFAGFSQNLNTNDTHHLVEPTAGSNNIAYASLPGGGAGTVQRLDTTAATGYDTREFPNGGTWINEYVTPGGTIGNMIWNAGLPSVTLAINGSQFYFSGQTRYGLLPGDFAAGRLAFTSSGNYGIATGTLTATRTYIYPDASGTVAFTNQLPLSGTTSNIGGGSLAAGACTTGTASVTSAAASMAVAASPATDPGTGFMWNAWVSAAGTVTVRVCNVSGASATPTATAYNVRAIQ